MNSTGATAVSAASARRVRVDADDTPPKENSAVPELTRRIIAAAVMLPIAVAAVWFGSWIFAVLVIVVTGIAYVEWQMITMGHRDFSAIALGLAAAMLAGVAMMLALPLGALLVMLLAALAAWLLQRDLYAPGGIVYALAPLIALIALRMDANSGLAAVFFVLTVVWATDTGAYFAGRLIGGPKLWPRVSPKKTWAGLIGGMICAAAVGLAAARLTGEAPAAVLALLGAALAVVAQAGDFLESALKRRFGVKDSGAIIPGHGGVMDRVDGIVTASCAAALLGAAHGGAANVGSGLMMW